MQRTYRIELTWEQRNGRWRWVMGDEEEWDAWWRWGVGNEEGGRGHGGCWPVMRERRWGVAMREVLAMRSRVKRGVGDEEWRQEKCWRWGVATREVSGYDGVAMSHDGDISAMRGGDVVTGDEPYGRGPGQCDHPPASSRRFHLLVVLYGFLIVLYQFYKSFPKQTLQSFFREDCFIKLYLFP